APNDMPVLYVRLKRSVHTRSIVRPSSSASTAHTLVSWSTTMMASASGVQRCQLLRAVGTGRSGSSTSAATDAADLLLDQHRRPGQRLEPLARDQPARHDRVAVRAGGDPLERGVD